MDAVSQIGNDAAASEIGNAAHEKSRGRRTSGSGGIDTGDRINQEPEHHPMPNSPFRVVQPWGPDKAVQATLISEHTTVAEAFAEIDRLAAQMVRTGAPSEAVELLVVDTTGRPVVALETCACLKPAALSRLIVWDGTRWNARQYPIAR